MDYFNENISPMLISLRALQLLLFNCCYKSSNNTEFNKWCKMILPKDLVLFSYLIVLTRASFKGPSGAAPWASYASKSGNIKHLIF